jgi:hypothetical protein
MTWLAIFAFFGKAGKAALSWLSHASLWQLVSLGLAALFIVQHFQFVSARHSAAKWEKVSAQYKVQLDTETEKNKAAEKQTAQISKQLKDRTDEENRRIAGDADTLRLRGPGKAVCPPVSGAPGEHQQATPDTNVAGPSLPTDERAAVPWNWLVQRAQEHDELLNENKAWRDWHDQVLKVWPKTTEARP